MKIIKWYGLQDIDVKLLLAAAAVLIIAGLILLIWALIDMRSKTEPKNIPKPPVKKGPLKAAVVSVIGSRSSQQDYAVTPEMLNIPQEVINQSGYLAVLCDGMGGLSGGARASSTACSVMVDRFYQGDNLTLKERFMSAIEMADEAVFGLKDEEGNHLHAGTTLITVLLKDNLAYWASVGDSRIYRYRDGNLDTLTRDHNYLMQLQEMVEAGEMEMSEALSHPQKEALISYVGMGGVNIIDVYPDGMEFMPGDCIILCSDGLYKALSEDEIINVIQTVGNDADALSKALVKSALEKTWMRHDNITVVAICNRD